MMMERLRDGANSLVVKIILGLIILSFVFAGVGGYVTGGSVAPAAEVGEVEISQTQFEQAYQNERQQMLSQAGDFFTSLLSDPNYLAQFRQNVLDKMVNQALLDQHAKSLGLRVSEAQIIEEIRGIPAFSNNGIFNNEQYLATLRRAGLTPEQFAQYIRQDIERQYLVGALQDSEFVLKNELESLYKLEGQERVVRTLIVPVEDFAEKLEVTDAQKKAYYEQNPNQFMRPEQYKVSYIELSGNSIAEGTIISEDDAKAYYDANKANYGTAEKRAVSHIMLQLDSEDAKINADNLLAKLRDGADFSTLAKANSEDTFSAEQGGKLDEFEKGVMDPAFENAAFSLAEVGDISEVIESEFGYHIIKLEDINKSDVKPFEEVKADIFVQLKQQKAAEQFYDLSTQMANKAFEVEDNLDEAAELVNAKVNTTDFVSLSALPGVLANQSVLQALQKSEVIDEGLNSEIVEIAPEHVVVLRIEESRPEIILPFEEVQPQITEQIKRIEGEKLAKALVDTLEADLKAGEQQSVTDSGYVFTPARSLKRDASEREVAQLAFTMPAVIEKTVFASARALNGDYILVALDEVKEPQKEEALLKQMSERVQSTYANADVSSVINQLKENTDITYSQQVIEQQTP